MGQQRRGKGEMKDFWPRGMAKLEIQSPWAARPHGISKKGLNKLRAALSWEKTDLCKSSLQATPLPGCRHHL
jgi:hypothetical protein